MIHFKDGPVAGQRLQLRRAPLFLRVVRNSAGALDALDQLDDSPEPQEEIFAYRLIGQPTSYHILCRDRRKPNATGWYMQAEYEVCPEQPTDAVMRSKHQWRDWCRQQASLPNWVEKLEVPA